MKDLQTQYRGAGIDAGFGRAGAVSPSQKVLRQTYSLLSLTLLFSAAMAGVSMALHVPYGLSLVCSLVSMGLLWFVVPRTANSEAGIWVVFGVTGLLGFGLGPILNLYLKMANGPQTVMMALGLTGTIFLGLSAYAVKTRRDFSFMRGFLVGGMILAFALSIGLLIASFFGVHLQPLSLAISAMFALLMCGMILYQTGEIINGGETNYVLATVSLYLSIYNLFISLLQILGYANNDD
ncbi:Bax inhibitor-1/YccA family protein [Hydrocarboniphaga sp.]|uniref:Bax inhibitor-1/YccA family protein n=1 Tax=Hydrocarboniphaga sp. TaxID=2033016 RepID=UPI003D10174A